MFNFFRAQNDNTQSNEQGTRHKRGHGGERPINMASTPNPILPNTALPQTRPMPIGNPDFSAPQICPSQQILARRWHEASTLVHTPPHVTTTTGSEANCGSSIHRQQVQMPQPHVTATTNNQVRPLLQSNSEAGNIRPLVPIGNTLVEHNIWQNCEQGRTRDHTHTCTGHETMQERNSGNIYRGDVG